MICKVVVRNARLWDSASRGAVLHDTLAELNWDTFFQLFFQESTLQVLVVCCAALFIFGGVSLSVCALVPVAVAVLLRLAVSVAQHAHTDQLLAGLRDEEFGLVAEVRPGVHSSAAAGRRLLLVEEGETCGGRVVATVSVARHRTRHGAGWVHALAVCKGWRRAGVARALLRAARARAKACGFTALEAEVTCRQTVARDLLQTDGWDERGGEGPGERALAGGLLKLEVLRLSVQLSPLHLTETISENRESKHSYAPELSAGTMTELILQY